MADIPASSGNIVRIGYARVSARAQDRQAQLDAPGASALVAARNGMFWRDGWL